MMSYYLITTYWLSELAASLFRVVWKKTFSWFTPADLQKERARNFIVQETGWSQYFCEWFWEDKILQENNYSGTSLKMGQAKSIKTPVTNYKSTWSPRHRTFCSQLVAYLLDPKYAMGPHSLHLNHFLRGAEPFSLLPQAWHVFGDYLEPWCSLFTGNLDVCLYARNVSCLIWWLLWRHRHFNFTLLDCYVLNIYRMNQIYWQTELHGTKFLRSSEVIRLLQIFHFLK